MTNFRLGLVLEPLNLAPRRAFERAAELGAVCVQFDAAGGLHPDQLGTTARRELKTLLRGFNLQLAAVQVPLRRGLDSAEGQQERIDHIRKVTEFARETGAANVAVPCPKIPEADTPQWKTLTETLHAIGVHGWERGVPIALECGIDSPETTVRLFGLDCGLKLLFDPANFLIHGHEPIPALAALAQNLAILHARDACRGGPGGGARETAIGGGDVEWMQFFAALSAFDFLHGLPVLANREEGPQRAADLESGLQFLQRFTAPATKSHSAIK